MPIKAVFFTNCLSLGKKFAKMLFYFINKSDIIYPIMCVKDAD